MPDVNAETILSGLSRLESLAIKYGPTVTGLVSTLADNLSGPANNAPSGAPSGGLGPVASHLGTRLHSVASLLECLFGTVETHATRAASAIGASAPISAAQTLSG